MSNAQADSEVPIPWLETPLVESAKLSKLAGCRVFMKLENLQPGGSFKSRGIGNLIRQSILSHPPSAKLHFYSSSGGNAGIAAVTAALTLGYPCTVVVPLSTKQMMVDKIKLAGATEVIQYGETWFHADQYLVKEVIPRAEAKGEAGVYVPPFDHPDLWAGAETMIDEIEVQLSNSASSGGKADGGIREKVMPDVVVLSVGGGGMLSGVAQGVAKRRDEQSGKDSTHIIAVETKGAESLHQSVVAGKLVKLSAITSIATTLGALQVAPQAFEWGSKSNCSSIAVDDRQAVEALLHFADDERVLVEPSCGASLAVIYSDLLRPTLEARGIEVKPELTVVVVVCGGVGVDRRLVAEWSAQYQV